MTFTADYYTILCQDWEWGGFKIKRFIEKNVNKHFYSLRALSKHGNQMNEGYQ